jgi:hypothetical protein
LLSGLNQANQTATTSDQLTISLVSYFLSLPLGGVIRATVTEKIQTVAQKPSQGKYIWLVSKNQDKKSFKQYIEEVRGYLIEKRHKTFQKKFHRNHSYTDP